MGVTHEDRCPANPEHAYDPPHRVFVVGECCCELIRLIRDDYYRTMREHFADEIAEFRRCFGRPGHESPPRGMDYIDGLTAAEGLIRTGPND